MGALPVVASTDLFSALNYEPMKNAPNMETDTPETDAAHHALIYGPDRFSFPAHARRMERERNEARREAEIWRNNAMNGWDGGYRVEFSWENLLFIYKSGEF
jgi:hypothetical protein